MRMAVDMKERLLNCDIFFTADPLVGSIATQYLQNREEHDRIARLWTKRYVLAVV